jgi:hypothetical protein
MVMCVMIAWKVDDGCCLTLRANWIRAISWGSLTQST